MVWDRNDPRWEVVKAFAPVAQAIVSLVAVLVLALHGWEGQHAGGVDGDDLLGGAGAVGILQLIWSGWWKKRNT